MSTGRRATHRKSFISHTSAQSTLTARARKSFCRQLLRDRDFPLRQLQRQRQRQRHHRPHATLRNERERERKNRRRRYGALPTNYDSTRWFTSICLSVIVHAPSPSCGSPPPPLSYNRDTYVSHSLPLPSQCAAAAAAACWPPFPSLLSSAFAVSDCLSKVSLPFPSLPFPPTHPSLTLVTHRHTQKK